jgi:hypothetical protein
MIPFFTSALKLMVGFDAFAAAAVAYWQLQHWH